MKTVRYPDYKMDTGLYSVVSIVYHSCFGFDHNKHQNRNKNDIVCFRVVSVAVLEVLFRIPKLFSLAWKQPVRFHSDLFVP